jgi:hypothetical protein
MSPGVPRHKRKADASSAWIFRLEFGAALIGLSVWGVALCRGIFRVSLGPDALPGDSSFANLGIWAAWALFLVR